MPVFAQNQKIQDIDTLIKTANNFYNNYQYDSAIVYYNKAQEEADKTSNDVKISQILSLKGRYFRHESKNDLAYKSYFEARKKALKLKNDTLCALADIGLGHIYERRGSLDSASYFYQHALTDYENVHDSLGVGLALLHLSMFYQTKIDYEKSLLYALESYRTYKKLNPNNEYYIWTVMNLGNIYEALKEYDTALSCYNQSYRLSVQKNNESLAYQSTINKALIYYHNKDYEKAKDEFLKAVPFYKKINDTEELSIIYLNTAIMYQHLGNFEEALKLSLKSLKYAREAVSKEVETKALLTLALTYKKKKDYEKAEKYYLESIALAEKTGLLKSLKSAYNNMAVLYKTTGKYKKGYEYLVKCSRVTDSITDKEKIRAREKYKAEYELLHLQDQNRINELEKRRIIFQRNLSLVIGLLVIILLVIILVSLRMKAKKNRIIAEQKIQKLEDEKKLMAAQSILVGQEKERERIAQELHDGIGVLLSTASIHFSSVESKTDKETSEMLKKANKLLKDASKEVRQISHNMMPGVLSKFGLQEAIEDIFEDVEDAGDMQVNLDIALGKGRLPENVEIMIYRIVQEMLNNTLKHARASVVSMTLLKKDNHLVIEYKDNGAGFDETKLPKDKNLGLLGIRTRAEYLGGSVDMKSEPGKGVSYRIIIPLKN
jgi:signal transduction histidine kinase